MRQQVGTREHFRRGNALIGAFVASAAAAYGGNVRDDY
jgi:hypothetical protein